MKLKQQQKLINLFFKIESNKNNLTFTYQMNINCYNL